jgi:hypothetical protein
MHNSASKSPDQQDQFHLPAVRGKIARAAQIPAMDMARNRATARAGRRGFAGTGVDPDRVPNKFDLFRP